MEIWALPVTIFAFLFGIACIFHGTTFINIEKHYHNKGGCKKDD